jgi:hypothetical protein
VHGKDLRIYRLNPRKEIFEQDLTSSAVLTSLSLDRDCEHCSIMPSPFNLTGLVEKEERYCFAHRVNADIWEGKYRGILVSANPPWPTLALLTLNFLSF